MKQPGDIHLDIRTRHPVRLVGFQVGADHLNVRSEYSWYVQDMTTEVYYWMWGARLGPPLSEMEVIAWMT